MVHRTNLVVQTLSNLPLVSCIENLLQYLYGYFSHSPKRHLKCTKMAKIMETKGNKILWSIKTRWISMISFVKHVLSKYRTLFMKMALDAPIIPFAKSNLSLLIDVESMLGLNVMMSMLKAIHSLIKFAKLKDVFVYDFITIVMIREGDVCCMFYDKQSSFEGNVFNNFTILINIIHENSNFHWIKDLNTTIDHLAFEFVGQHMWATSLN